MTPRVHCSHSSLLLLIPPSLLHSSCLEALEASRSSFPLRAELCGLLGRMMNTEEFEQSSFKVTEGIFLDVSKQVEVLLGAYFGKQSDPLTPGGHTLMPSFVRARFDQSTALSSPGDNKVTTAV